MAKNDFRKAGSVKDDRPGRPNTAVTDENIEEVQDLIQKDRGFGVRAVAEEANLGTDSVRRILSKALHKNGSKTAVR
jgi:DNA invertase Pin-like site-specific DNA recombinase